MSQIEITVVIHESRLKNQHSEEFRTVKISGEESAVLAAAQTVRSRLLQSWDEVDFENAQLSKERLEELSKCITFTDRQKLRKLNEPQGIDL